MCPSPSCVYVPLPSATPQEERRRAEVEEEKLRFIREEARIKVGVANPIILMW